MKLALITPAFAKDREILDLSCAQVDRHCGQIHHFVVPSRAERQFFRHLTGQNRTIIYKEDIFELPIRRVPGYWFGKEIFLVDYVHPVRGWIMQQIIKFYAPDFTDADVLIYVDSDVFMIRNWSETQFVLDGRVRLLKNPGAGNIETHWKWHRSAGRLFGLAKKSYYGADFIAHLVAWRRDTCLELRKFLEQKWGTPWPRLLSREPHISEYILYGIYVDEVLLGDSQRHYATDKGLCLSSFHYAGGPQNLVSQLLGGLGDEYVAFNIQSNLRAPIAIYKQALLAVSQRIAGESSPKAPGVPPR